MDAQGPVGGPPDSAGAVAAFARERHLAVDIAETAGRILLEGWGTRPTVAFKGEDINLVTEFDHRSERLVVDRLAAAFPDDLIIGEEGGPASPTASSSSPGRNGRVWYVDPLDGTTNFAHGFPLFSVSIGLVVGGVARVGVVTAPAMGWTFAGTVGQGATLNGKAIQPSRVPALRAGLVVTGFPYSRTPTQDNLGEWSAMVRAAQGTRRLGSAALDLCFVACGWMDVYWERMLHPWDLVAGAAIVNARRRLRDRPRRQPLRRPHGTRPRHQRHSPSRGNRPLALGR